MMYDRLVGREPASRRSTRHPRTSHPATLNSDTLVMSTLLRDLFPRTPRSRVTTPPNSRSTSTAQDSRDARSSSVETVEQILVLGTDGALRYQTIAESDRVMRGFDVSKFLPRRINQDECADVCSICLEDMQVGEDVTPLQCKHLFHSKCICTWLSSRVRQGFAGCCPNCNHQVCSPIFSETDANVASTGIHRSFPRIPVPTSSALQDPEPAMAIRRDSVEPARIVSRHGQLPRISTPRASPAELRATSRENETSGKSFMARLRFPLLRACRIVH